MIARGGKLWEIGSYRGRGGNEGKRVTAGDRKLAHAWLRGKGLDDDLRKVRGRKKGRVREAKSDTEHKTKEGGVGKNKKHFEILKRTGMISTYWDLWQKNGKDTY